MSRLLRLIRDAASVFAAARNVSAAVSQHRMPAEDALRALGITGKDFAKIRI